MIFQTNFFRPYYETIDVTVFPLSWMSWSFSGSLIPNGERWESLWQMQIWKHREWWATWILGWSGWNPNKPEQYLHLFISYIFLGDVKKSLRLTQFIGWIWGSFRRFGLVTSRRFTNVMPRPPGEGRWIKTWLHPLWFDVVGNSWMFEIRCLKPQRSVKLWAVDNWRRLSIKQDRLVGT